MTTSLAGRHARPRRGWTPALSVRISESEGPATTGVADSEARRDIQIHEPAVLFRDRRLVLPADAERQRDRRPHSPIVGDEGTRERLAKILVRVSIGDRAGCGNTQKEVREITFRRCSVNVKLPRGSRCEYRLNCWPAVVGAVGEAVAATNPGTAVANLVRQVSIRRISPARQTRYATGEVQRGRSPVSGIPVVAGDSCNAGDVNSIGKIRPIGRRR